jgi:hypothetical protein
MVQAHGCLVRLQAAILDALSPALRSQVVLHIYKSALECVPFFKGKPAAFLESVVTLLKLEYYRCGARSRAPRAVSQHSHMPAI